MTFSLAIPTCKATRPTPRSDTPVRVVPAPAPKTFVLDVEWEETNTEPITLPVHVKPATGEPPSFATRILRLTVPLELRLDPTL
ncbi:MAG: hypothetical protein QM813_15590 [Verrucomicrobiota bacterium]